MDRVKRITAERLREVLHYSPETGVFTWLITQSNRKLAGSIAGGPAGRGYLRIAIDGQRYQSHRLAWLYMTGGHPVNDIDHLNGDKRDNRFSNLRDVNNVTNLHNQRKAHPHNKSSGMLGVSFHQGAGKYTAQIHHAGKKIHLGCFTSAEEAREAYLCAKRDLHSGMVE